MYSRSKSKIREIVKKHYWAQHPEAAIRYYPVIREIRKANLNGPKILEIGSGSTGITPYLKQSVDAVDIDFSGPKSKFINRIKGKAWELPFKKNVYDISISVDVLEHIPPQFREKAISEMIRVTSKLAIIVVPTSSDSEKQDEELRNRWNKVFNIKNLFLEEHVKYGLPQSEDILVYVDKAKRSHKKNIRVGSYSNLNLAVRKLLMYMWITKNKYVYYTYLKGLLPLVPILRLMNFGKSYRKVFVLEFRE